MNKNKIIFFLLFIQFSFSVNSQPLDDLLKMGAENNPEIKAFFQEYLAAMEKGIQVSQLPDPEIGVGIFTPINETHLGKQWLKASASQMFPWFGVLKTRKAVADAAAKSKLENIEVLKLDLFFKIKIAYFEWYELEKSIAIIQRDLDLFGVMKRTILSKVESGKGSMTDVLQVQIKIQKLEYELLILENKKAKPLATLKELINQSVSTSIAIKENLVLAEMPALSDLEAQHFLNTHPAIISISLDQSTANQSIRLNDLERRPSFGLGLDYISVNELSSNFEGNGQDIYMPKVMVKLPIYKKKFDARQQEKELEINSLEFKKESIKNKYIAQLEIEYINYREAILEIELFKKQIKTTRSAIEILQTEYSVSGEHFDKLLKLKSDILNYELKILNAIVKSHLAKASVERFVLK